MALTIERHQIESHAPAARVVEAERPLMNKGRLFKVRFTDQPVPNVRWVWWPVGNCGACRFNTPDGALPDVPGHCDNPEVAASYREYLERNDCPGYQEGAPGWALLRADDQVDALRAAGVIAGEPKQKVEVLKSLPWSTENARLAGAQQAIFQEFAQLADAAKAGGWELGSHYEHHDVGDDLSAFDPPTA